jgi:aspartate carbamoyltransferase regulatory subunit
MTEKNEPKVGRIKNGTVLDHLNEGSAQRILEMIGVLLKYYLLQIPPLLS